VGVDTVLAPPTFRDVFWSHGQTIVFEICLFGKEAAQNSEVYEFHSCALYRESLSRELFAKIPSLPSLVLAVTLFRS